MKIVAAAAVLLCLVLLLPVGVRLRYDGALAVRAALGPAALRVYPPKPPNYKKLARKQARARKRRAAAPPAKPPAKAKAKLSPGQWKALASLGLEAAGSLPRRLLVRQLTVHVACGGSDAAAAALAYGRAWAAIGALTPVLENTFRIGRRDLAARLDYQLEGFSWLVELDVRIRVGTALLLGLKLLIRLIPILLQTKKKAVQAK